MVGQGAVHAVPAAVRNRRTDPYRRRCRCRGTDPASPWWRAPSDRVAAGQHQPARPRAPGENGGRTAFRHVAETGDRPTITLSHFMVLGAVLFCIAVASLFINRKNVIVLLMSIELMLLAVDLNFVASSRFIGDPAGQVFVFFILTVAAAETAIGLAILGLLFRNRSTINITEIDSMKG